MRLDPAAPPASDQELLSDRHRRRLDAMFADDRHLPFAMTWRVYPDVIDAYADHDRRRSKKRLARVIDTIRSVVRTVSTNSPSLVARCIGAAPTCWRTSTPRP
ncbi:hypothetical protein [Rhodococcus sp. LW-XY12]|uniref:hypothetical protein n=1 Tax=Rhodococcus sp. LW-XY12 TaxID=2856851 RepID=UPI001C57C7FF|nr:hypothetical protein [Rhodococcus sp. LW-XY12]QXU56626.1 hypothetical protein KXC42_25665 [Rhodococcus sp. LW-XY12]